MIFTLAYHTMRQLLRTAFCAQAMVARPFRHARLRRMASASEAPVSVLFYHRVADHTPNDWSTTRATFRSQIEYCRKHFDVVDLAEVQRRVRECESSSMSVAITFDDGYADNSDYALPLLVELGVPATYFVSTAFVRDQRYFPHDERTGQPLNVNTVAQLRRAAEQGIEIGCHTRHHVDFSRLYDPRQIRSEIIDAKDELEQMIGRSVRYLAFPFGLPAQLTQAAIEAVYEAGFHGFCSAYGGYNLPGGDPFHIRRFHADPCSAKFVNWLGFDRRKLRLEPSVRYFLPPHGSFEATATDHSLCVPTNSSVEATAC
ncbi:MAG: polysaccharide deacetylase family protein [Rubripirellula sp.]